MAQRPTSCREKAEGLSQDSHIRIEGFHWPALALPGGDWLGVPSWTSFRLCKEAGKGRTTPPLGTLPQACPSVLQPPGVGRSSWLRGRAQPIRQS